MVLYEARVGNMIRPSNPQNADAGVNTFDSIQAEYDMEFEEHQPHPMVNMGQDAMSFDGNLDNDDSSDSDFVLKYHEVKDSVGCGHG
ncbi:hypothetical protein L1887_29099 [Cichorium endivia]|nr:hypothetical protein L1887_29099 [Cichorium endivia]